MFIGLAAATARRILLKGRTDYPNCMPTFTEPKRLDYPFAYHATATETKDSKESKKSK